MGRSRLITIVSEPQSFQFASDLATAFLNQAFCVGAEEGPSRVLGVRAGLEQRVVAGLRVAVLALVGEEELRQAAELRIEP